MFVKDFGKTALKIGEKNISYAELIKNIKNFSSVLNIEKGDKVAVFSENRPEWIYSFFSIWQSKGIAVPIDFMSTADEVAYILNDCEPVSVFCSENNRETLLNAVSQTKYKPEIFVFEDMNFTGENKDFEDWEPDKNDTAVILYTSGTTGNPKGVMLTYDNLYSNIEGIVKADVATKEDKTIAILPYHHSYPLTVSMLTALYLGATISFITELSSEAILKTMQRDKITVLVGVPRLYNLFHRNIMEKINSNKITKILFKISKKINNQKLSRKIFKKVHDAFGGNIKYFVSGGAKLDEEIASDLWALGFTILEGYGLTETSPIVSFNRPDKLKLGSAGLPLEDVDVKIVDGEIVVKGRNVMKGYYNKPEATAEVLKDGWFYTGDLGKIDEDGFLYITGRKKEIIVLPNGKNINPEELENKILKMSDLVKEIAVIMKGGQLWAIVYPDFDNIRRKKIVNIEETIKWNVIDKFNQQVPSYKRISGVKIVNKELPKTRLGKIRRFLLPKFLEEVEKKPIEKIKEPEFEEYKIIKGYLEKVTEKAVLPTDHLEIDLGLDSLEKVEFQVFIEKTFGIRLSDEDLIKHPTVEEISKFVKERKTKIQMEEVDWSNVLKEEVEIDLKEISFPILILKRIIQLFFKIYFRYKVSGIKNIPETPSIIAPNHQSLLDGFLIVASLPDELLKNSYFLAEESHFNTPFRKFLARNFHILIVNINKDLKGSLQKTASLLRKGKNVVIFPEGARTRDGSLLPFKKSFAILSKELNVPVVPTVIKGAYEAFPIGSKLPKPKKIKISYLLPINPDGYTYEEIVKKTKEAIEKQLNTD